MIGVVWAAQGTGLRCHIICRLELRLFQRSQLCVSYRHGCIWGHCSNYEPVHVLLELERYLCSDSYFVMHTSRTISDPFLIICGGRSSEQQKVMRT